MTFTSVADYEKYNRTFVPEELREHIQTALDNAEDDLVRELGASFFDSAETQAGRDWLRLASWRAAEYIRVTSVEFQEAMSSPFQSETIGRYSYVLRSPQQGVGDNPRYKAILDFYRGIATAPIQYNDGSTRVGDEYWRPMQRRSVWDS